MMIGPIFASCIAAAASLYDLPESILYAVHKVEGGKAGTVVGNTNGTHDHGPMQVNTVWVKKLADMYGKPESVIKDKLANDVCFNVHVSAWILKGEMLKAGDFWEGVGRYHSRTPGIKERYQKKVVEAAADLYGKSVFRKGE